MLWINQADLRNWAGRLGARENFPVMVRDLVLASARDIGDIKHMRFPGGESGQVRGYDGDLTMAVGSTYVPTGRSIWEFGVGVDAADKFEGDYNKRVKTMPAADRQQCTFVFVTPRNWDNPKKKLPDYVSEFVGQKEFKDVRYIDGAMLETWLGLHSAVGATYARTVLERIPQKGARSTDEFWAEYSARFRPKLTEAVALCARQEQAAEMIRHLMGKRGQLIFVGDGPDEVSAVAVAAIRTAPELDRNFLQARTLIVDTDDAGREVAVADRYGYVVSPSVRNVTGALGSCGPVIATLDFQPAGNRHIRLERPSTREMSEALRTMNLSDEDAEVLARKSGRSLTILERHAPAAGAKRPEWAGRAAPLIPALLVGGWNSRQEGDRRALSELSGLGYDDFEENVREYLNQLDAPLDHQAGLWKLRAPVDAFVNLSHLVTRKHLDKLALAARTIFSTPEPSNNGAESFGVSDAIFSNTLREGVATTLLIVAAMHRELGLEAVDNPQRYVEEIVGDLQGLRDDPRVILGLEQQLTYLMEAAPRPLLDALEQMLEGEGTLASSLFGRSTEYGASQRRLPHVLWALEMQAWDPSYLRRVSLLLAKLASIDPGGRSGNRPINSLRSIFVAWSPDTNASMSERIAAIDEIHVAFPEVGWQLVLALLPKLQDSKVPNQRPRFREAGASDREPVTQEVVKTTYDAITDRALSLIEGNLARWSAIAEVFPRFSPDHRTQFLDMLTAHVATIVGEGRAELRRALTRIAERHARFPDAGWALSPPELARLQLLTAMLKSDDPFEQARVLFDEANPYAEADYLSAEKALEQRRSDSIAAIASLGGASAVLQLSESIRMPKLAAFAAATGLQDQSILDEILMSGMADEPASNFVIALSGNLRRLRGPAFWEHLARISTTVRWSAIRMASMLLEWPEEPLTWRLVDGLGAQATRYFWKHREPSRFEGSTKDLETLVFKFVAAGRASTALVAVYPRATELSWQVASALLQSGVAEINHGTSNRSVLDEYYVSELFKSLRDRADVNKNELVRLEYAYFPLLEHNYDGLLLFDRMAADPEFFVSILSDVYIRDGDDRGERVATPEEQARESISHRILMANKAVPGEKNGVVDGRALNAWVDGMIEEGRKARLTKIVPMYIGRVLAHAAPENGVWPPPQVASVIERLRSDEVEKSIVIERFNMRGVYTKAMFEGGAQERELAEKYREWSKANGSHARTKSLLALIARHWDDDATSEDERAARDKLTYE